MAEVPLAHQETSPFMGDVDDMPSVKDPDDEPPVDQSDTFYFEKASDDEPVESDGWAHGARIDEIPRRRMDYTRGRENSLQPIYRPHDNLGILTLRLTQQRRFLRELIMEGLAIGLVASDAVRRATDALEYIRLHARTAGLDSGAQKSLRWFCRAALRSQGAEGGGVLGARAIEAARLMEEFLDKARAKEKKDARRGKVDE